MTTHPKFDRRREVVEVHPNLLLDHIAARGIRGQVDERWCDNALLAFDSTDEHVRELGTRVRHREGSRASAVLGLYDLITSELDAVRKLLNTLLSKVGREGVRRLREQGDNLN